MDPQQACRKPRTRTTSSVGDKQDTRESHGDDELKHNESLGLGASAFPAEHVAINIETGNKFRNKTVFTKSF